MITSTKNILCPVCKTNTDPLVKSQVQMYNEPIKVYCEQCKKEFMATYKNVIEYQSWNIGE